MSGGQYEYIYQRIAEINICTNGTSSFKRVVFQQLLQLVAEAMHDIEWVDSGDYSEGDEARAIDACLNFLKVETAFTDALKYKYLKDSFLRTLRD